MIGPILSLIGGSVGRLMSSPIVWAGVIVISLIGALGLAYKRVEALNQELSHERVIKEQVLAHNRELLAQYKNVQGALTFLGDKLVMIDRTNSELSKALSKARSKEHVVSKKPLMVQRRINVASKRMFNDIAGATGYKDPGNPPQ